MAITAKRPYQPIAGFTPSPLGAPPARQGSVGSVPGAPPGGGGPMIPTAGKAGYFASVAPPPLPMGSFSGAWSPTGGLGWGGFSNGMIPASAMTNVYGFEIAPFLAQNLTALLGAAQKAGVWNPSTPYATGTYRPLSVQQQLWNAYQSGSHPAPAARPGTSLHGWGEAIDFNMNDQALINWLRGNAPQYGFYNSVSGEPWHYDVGSSFNAPGGSGSPIPIPTAMTPPVPLPLTTPARQPQMPLSAGPSAGAPMRRQQRQQHSFLPPPYHI